MVEAIWVSFLKYERTLFFQGKREGVDGFEFEEVLDAVERSRCEDRIWLLKMSIGEVVYLSRGKGKKRGRGEVLEDRGKDGLVVMIVG